MSKILKNDFFRMYKFDGHVIDTERGKLSKEQIHCVVSRDDDGWLFSLASERKELMFQIPFNEVLKDIIEEVLRAAKKE